MPTLKEARAVWSNAQGLHGDTQGSIPDVVANTGWIRTIGGCEAYLGIAARTPGVTVAKVNSAVEAGELLILPSVRGCIFLTPAADAGIALRISRELGLRTAQRSLEKAGGTELELQQVGEAVMNAVASGPLSTAQLRKALPDGVIRSLGQAGKKVGVTSTLPPALRRLEWEGLLRRVPVDHRIDHEKYIWVAGDGLPEGPDGADLHVALAARYFAWLQVSTLARFAWWSGLTKTKAKKAIEACDLEAVHVDGIGAAFALPGAFDRTTSTETVAMLPGYDNLWALSGGGPWLVDPAQADISIVNFSTRPDGVLGESQQPLTRTLSCDGRIVGTWEWDPGTGELVHADVVGAGPSPTAVATATQIFADLGHSKVFSIDKQAKMLERAQRTRNLLA